MSVNRICRACGGPMTPGSGKTLCAACMRGEDGTNDWKENFVGGRESAELWSEPHQQESHNSECGKLENHSIRSETADIGRSGDAFERQGKRPSPSRVVAPVIGSPANIFDERLRDWQDIAQGYKEGASQ